MKTGAQLIAEERTRQVQKEGWTKAHDDGHGDGSLALAAICYAAPIRLYRIEKTIDGYSVIDPWPESWGQGYDKRFRYGDRRSNPGNIIPDPASYTNAERVDLLTKAGALIAAEIDRLKSLQSTE